MSLLHDIKELSVPEKVELAEMLWDSIHEDSSEIAISDKDQEKLRSRVEEVESGKYHSFSWEEVKQELQDRRS